VKNTRVEYVDGGHFVLENHLEEMAEAIIKFLEKSKI